MNKKNRANNRKITDYFCKEIVNVGNTKLDNTNKNTTVIFNLEKNLLKVPL